MTLRPLILLSAVLLAGCDLQSIQAAMADPRIAQREAEAKAIGSACRHGLRSIEDCYSLNEKASKAAIFEGWKEMDSYMRENKIEGIAPQGLKPPPPPPPADSVITEKSDEEPKAKSKAKAKAEH
ncbi:MULTISPECIES: hypothetical protein [Comamonadaceae]|jgi:hypothetical protein|uniref:Uncharacterized protein n=1 Tax=Rhodoferax mekongensis TaxID=3068341 RepID=A0ABZ0AWB9_9BURK|nr:MULTISPECIES: hypothetical protein [Comamonadaceae]ARV17758.1 hypothetical protein AEP_00799 [Curvibacter sp. AEP1-3]MDT7515266.1 hypothetical protein [Rhodoferax sp. TBRC 17199]WNO03908.1 hypothetical protein RAN89_13425 [Rhodoferax sp. TBRC 17307]